MKTNLAKYSLILVFTLLATLLYWQLYGRPVVGIDDANIYFIYVRNFVNGNGFVYSIHGKHVEGFTSILWVLLISPLFWLGENFEPAIQVLNVITVSITLFAGVNFVNRITESKTFISAPALFFLVLIAAIPGYFDWTVLTLMETGLWSFLLTIITILLCREHFDLKTLQQLTLLLGLLVLTRPESLLWVVVFLALVLLRLYFQNQKLLVALTILKWPTVFITLLVIFLTVFRLFYFGYPLPNTYYAKVSTNTLYNIIEGVHYFILCVIQSPLLLIIIPVALVSLILISRDILKAMRQKTLGQLNQIVLIHLILSIVTIISILIPIYVGGDHFKLLRFYQPFMLVYLFLLFNIRFWKLYITVNINFAIGLYAKIFLLILFVPFIYLLTDSPLHTFLKTRSPLDGEFRLAELGLEEGRLMNDFFSGLNQLPSVGVSAAGGFGYTYKGQVIDLMGLNNEQMAHALKEKVGMKNHAAFDKVTFYNQKPDVFHGYKKISGFVGSLSDTVLLENDPEFESMHVFRLYKKIFRDQDFQLTYFPAVISDPGGKRFLKSYFTKAFLEKLTSHGYHVFLVNRNKLSSIASRK